MGPLQLTGLECQFEIVSPGCDTDRPASRRSPPRAGVTQPDDADHHRGQTATHAESQAHTEPDEYAHLVALQWRYAQLTPHDPQRPRLRAQLISGYLPVAEHLARRFVGRGQPHDDLV